ncbi:MAG TPA: hypothetical protein O0W88_02405 [Methanocorpusculum sp.]|nr:hypothetical protein [Methanocorpusculum sp.]
MTKIQRALEMFFHHQTFRKNQEEIIRDVVSGCDVLIVMVTGGGKSFCYLLLAMLSRCRVALIAVDEANCISLWGHQFRPEYREDQKPSRNISNSTSYFPNRDCN